MGILQWKFHCATVMVNKHFCCTLITEHTSEQIQTVHSVDVNHLPELLCALRNESWEFGSVLWWQGTAPRLRQSEGDKQRGYLQLPRNPCPALCLLLEQVWSWTHERRKGKMTELRGEEKRSSTHWCPLGQWQTGTTDSDLAHTADTPIPSADAHHSQTTLYHLF